MPIFKCFLQLFYTHLAALRNRRACPALLSRPCRLHLPTLFPLPVQAGGCRPSDAYMPCPVSPEPIRREGRLSMGPGSHPHCPCRGDGFGQHDGALMLVPSAGRLPGSSASQSAAPAPKQVALTCEEWRCVFLLR